MKTITKSHVGVNVDLNDEETKFNLLDKNIVMILSQKNVTGPNPHNNGYCIS
jgi:hypothetical protein